VAKNMKLCGWYFGTQVLKVILAVAEVEFAGVKRVHEFAKTFLVLYKQICD
jgi:hypothetical protein